MEIDRQYDLNALSGPKDTFRQIDYVLNKLESWLITDNFSGNQDAEVFLDAFQGYFEELSDMINEMDEGKVSMRPR